MRNMVSVRRVATTRGPVTMAYCLVEDLVDLGDAVTKQILKANHHGRAMSHVHGFLHNIENSDVFTVTERMHGSKAFGVHGKVVCAPALEPIEFFGFGG